MPEVLARRRGGGCLVLFGLPFLLSGLVLLTAPMPWFPMEGRKAPPWYLAMPLGLVFAGAGAALIFGRSGVVVNRRDRTAYTWWGLLVPFRRKCHSLDEFSRVTISREVRQYKNSSYTVFPVRLKGDAAEITLEELGEYPRARQVAEELAKFVNLGIVDTSEGKAVTREAGRLDESLRERARRTGQKVRVPDPPAAMRTRCQVEERRVILDLPPPGLSLPASIGIALCVVMASGLIYAFILFVVSDRRPLERGPLVAVLVGVVFLAVLVGALAATLRSYLARTRVIASPDSLRVERRGLLRTTATEIPAAELEELLLGSGAYPTGGDMPRGVRTVQQLLPMPGRGIQARSDRAIVEFGAHLADDELRWIHAVIMKMMTV